MTLTVNSDAHFMKEAMKEAAQAYEKDEVPVGAVVVCDGKIIARAHNLTETLHDVTAHAEMLAITSASNFLGGKYLENCSLYVSLEPCLMCAAALNHARISKVVWAANDPKAGFSRLEKQVLHPKTTVMQGLMADESSELLKDFFRKKRE